MIACRTNYINWLIVAFALLLSCAASIAGDKHEDPQVAALRTELTSKNRKPVIKRSEGGEEPTVVIAENFSWAEQNRVQGAIQSRCKNPTEEFVIQLLSIIHSSDYCISTINDNESIWNKDVGRVAADLVESIIKIPVTDAFQDVPADETNFFKKALQVEDGFAITDAKKLLTENRLKLYQVQFYYLEKNKAELQKKYPNDKLAAEVIQKIDAHRKTIGESKKPMLQAIEYPIREEYFDKSESSRAKIILATPPK